MKAWRPPSRRWLGRSFDAGQQLLAQDPLQQELEGDGKGRGNTRSPAKTRQVLERESEQPAEEGDLGIGGQGHLRRLVRRRSGPVALPILSCRIRHSA